MWTAPGMQGSGYSVRPLPPSYLRLADGCFRGRTQTMNLAEICAHLLATEHVRDLHDLHTWTDTSSLPALSAPVVVDDSCFNDGHAPRLLDGLQACAAGHFDVEHSTFQLEPAAHAGHESGTY
jgi:cobalt-zinc-cadmium efflux system protein